MHSVHWHVRWWGLQLGQCFINFIEFVLICSKLFSAVAVLDWSDATTSAYPLSSNVNKQRTTLASIQTCPNRRWYKWQRRLKPDAICIKSGWASAKSKIGPHADDVLHVARALIKALSAPPDATSSRRSSAGVFSLVHLSCSLWSEPASEAPRR